jgi:putative ABC transport system permease protein
MELSRAAAQRFEAKYGPTLTARPWEYYGQGILENERGDRIFYAIFLIILLFISVSTIMSTMYVNVFERTREIGTMRAMGWTRGEIFRLFMFESLAIGCVGSLAGFVIGGIPTAYLALVGIDYGRLREAVAVPLFKIISRPEAYDFLIAFALGVAATYLGGLLPARKASRMIVTDALRM